MADKRLIQPNILRQAIREQLEKTSSSVTNKQRPFASVENKPNRGLRDLFSNFFRTNKQEGVIIANPKLSAKNELEVKPSIEYGKFEQIEIDLESLKALTLPQNRKQEISKNKELQEISDNVKLFKGEIEERIQDLPISEAVEIFDGKIEDDSQELKTTSELEKFEGEILDKGEELSIAKDVSLFEGEILDNGEELPTAKNVSLFEGEILNNGEEIPIAKEVSEFQGEIKDKGKELKAFVDGGGVGDSQFNGKIKESDKDLQIEDAKQLKKRKADEATIASSEGKVLVEVTADENGKIIDINSYNLGAFTKPNATKLARKKGTSAKAKIQAKVNRAKKSARHRSDDQGRGISLVR